MSSENIAEVVGSGNDHVTTTMSTDDEEGGSSSSSSSSSAGEVTALHDLIAGGVAGSASVVVGHPFDTIKVRLQTSSASNSSSSKNGTPGGVGVVAPGGGGGFQSLFRGMAAPLSTAAVVNAIIFATYGSCTRLWEDVFENGRHDREDGPPHGTVTREGVLIEHGEHGTHEQIRGWKKKQQQRQQQRGQNPEGGEGVFVGGSSSFGSSSDGFSSSSSSSPSSPSRNAPAATTTTSGDDDEEGAPSHSRAQNTLKVFSCGAAAGTVQAFVICPMEHIKCRLQASSSPSSSSPPRPRRYAGPYDVASSILRSHGLAGLYRGMAVTLWRETPAFGLYFATYDTAKDSVERLLEEKDDDHPIPSHAHAWAASALAGGMSGAFTWAIIYPFDVIKTRIQTSPLEERGTRRKGMWVVARDIAREEGWRHMFRGLGVTLARAFPVNAIIFPVYEFVLMQLGDG